MKQNFDDLIAVLEAEIKFRVDAKKTLRKLGGIAPHTVSVYLHASTCRVLRTDAAV